MQASDARYAAAGKHSIVQYRHLPTHVMVSAPVAVFEKK